MIPLVLFLDIDGVLNNSRSVDDGCFFNPFNMNNLKHLCTTLNPKIVLSSDWRRSPTNLAIARSELLYIGLTIFDTTSFGPHLNNRANEIKDWLDQEKWGRAIILDDMEEEFVNPNVRNLFFHRTDYRLGLTEEDVDSIIGRI